MTGARSVRLSSSEHERLLQAPNAWRVVALLAVANLLNFYDRTIPAILVEPIKEEFGLGDFEIGLLSAGFTVVYAIAGVFLGRMADRRSRRMIMGWGLLGWSLLTAASGGAWSFAVLLLVRLGVGVGEAAYAPAANSTIADLFPATARSKAVAVFQMGLPVGLTLAFFTTGFIAEAFDSWRAPFFVAAVPGVVVALALFFVREPERGASEEKIPFHEARASTDGPIRTIVRIPTMWWLIVSGIGLQVVANGVATFLVPLFQRYFGLSLTDAALHAGVVLGVTGILGLLLGGAVADRASRHSRRSRILVGAVALLGSAPLAFLAFQLSHAQSALFVVVFSLSWFLQFFFHTTALPAVADVVPPALRSTAIAIFFAAFYLLGGAFGPLIGGALSEYLASGAVDGAVSAEAYGLHSSLGMMTPIALLVASFGLFGASRTITSDHERMTSGGGG